MTIQCPQCQKTYRLNRLELRVSGQFKDNRIMYRCRFCGTSFQPLPAPKKTRTSDDIRRSRTQEKRAAIRFAAVRQKASGALPGIKGDVRLPGKIRLECKLTRKNSYTLKLQDLVDLEAYASAGEDPIFEIEFQNSYPHRRYVVLPGWLYDQYWSKGKVKDTEANGQNPND